jgi:hypothetical protein
MNLFEKLTFYPAHVVTSGCLVVYVGHARKW